MGLNSKTIRNQSGQLTIFLAITLVIIMGLLAFIINVGLFVKAKINLQNATDAAAFSGAATQARQLTNISYLNWEMRNTFKEWMFKYYLLGQLHYTLPPNPTYPRSGSMHNDKLAGNGPVNFLLSSFDNTNPSAFDKYNVPSICIHNNSASSNICSTYNVPGLPRFESLNIAGISDIHERFVNKLVEEKAANCTTRTQLNFLAASAWAYSTGVDIPGAPLIAGGRIGAWVQALELALRMRNLEMIVNRPPVSRGINFQNVQELENTGAVIGYNERPLKAFYSAYRNLGGGKYKDADQSQDELSGSFKLYEIAPSPYQAIENSASTFLIPSGVTFPSESATVTTKYYLDLKAYSLNYATLYTSFLSNTENFDNAGTQSEAGCGVSKSAIPVPGYILGFEKNPEVLTYYAVKGEANFIGLFYPFTKQEGIKLTAYSAAKPFGGRIGPKLFSFTNGDRAIRPRDDKTHYPSASHATAFNFTANELTGAFKVGDMIPQTKSFWSDSFSSNIGGIPGSGETVNFVVPNMIYDAVNISDLQIQTGESQGLQVIRPAGSGADIAKEKLGLHEKRQIFYLKKALGPVSTTLISSDQLDRAFAAVRKPTVYDALNYLIPDLTQRPEANAPAVVIPLSRNGDIVRYRLFAPLLGENLLYRESSDVIKIVREYLNANKQSVESYMKGLHDAAKSVATNTSPTDPNLGKKAARSIHAGFESGSHIPPELNCTYLDVASRYWHFFTKDAVLCDVEPLPRSMDVYLTKISGANKDTNYYYDTTYVENTELGDRIYSAYFPGKNLGSDGPNAIVEHPLKVSTAGSAYSAKRNFYSTKFIELSKVVKSGVNSYEENAPLRELPDRSPPDLLGQINIKNLIPSSDVSDLKKIEH